MYQKEIEGHAGESERNDEPEDHCKEIEKGCILLVDPSHCLESRLKAMLKMVPQEDQCEDVESVVERILKILDNKFVSRVLRAHDSGRDEKRVQVDDEEDENRAAGPDGNARGERRVVFEAELLIVLRSGGSVFPPHYHAEDGMSNNAAEQKYLYKANDRIVHQELGVCLIRSSPIFLEQQQISDEMLDQEGSEEQSRKTHQDFFADGGFGECNKRVHRNPD
jgi:hypothetical protein